MHAFAKYKLGKYPFTPKAKDLKLSTYINKATLIDAQQVPAASNWAAMLTSSGSLPEPDDDELGNDTIGDCVFAAIGHHVRMIGQQTCNPQLCPGRGAIVDAYAQWTGYNPTTGTGDNGAVVRDVLGIWQREGLYGTKALAYVLVNHRDPDECMIASWIGCGTIGGYSLPISAQSQVDATGRQLWFVPPSGFPSGQGPGSWGGHCIWEDAPSPSLDGGNSWGEKMVWTPEWRRACQDECWLVLVDAWKLVTGRAPNGFAWEQLLSDVAARTAL